MRDGEHFAARTARYLRIGPTNAWLEVALRASCKRQICRLLASFEVSIVRLTVGPLSLVELPKGQWQMLMKQEFGSL